MMEKMTHSRLLLYEKGRWGLVTILSSNFEERTSELYSENGANGLLLMETSFVYAGEQNFTANARITYVSGPASNHTTTIRFGYINDSGTFAEIRKVETKYASDAYNEITEGGYSIVSTYTDPTNSQKKACAGRKVVLALRTYFKNWSFDKIEIQIA